MVETDSLVIERLRRQGREMGLAVGGGKVRRTSSRFCLGVEHGDYNGTELFGVGTDRFIWMAYKPNNTNRVRIYSENFAAEGIIEFELGNVPEPKSSAMANSWGRFPCGVEYVLRQNGYKLKRGMEALLYGNIPGGGLSRSASLSLNLILSLLDVNDIAVEDKFKIVDMAQAVENVYIGSPCGQLDQIMILFAQADMGTHYNPADKTIKYVPLGATAEDFRLVVMDTGTVRGGLEKSTYKIRRSECEEFVGLLGESGYAIKCLAQVCDEKMYGQIMKEFGQKRPEHCKRLNYIYHAQKRFYKMLEAWRRGDIVTVGDVFRKDGIGLRDDYQISGPELEAMCDIARGVNGVLGERMLGGGDKGASGALVRAENVDDLRRAIDEAYPRMRPEYKDKYAVHVCKVVDGVKVFDEGVL
jgi:galactokinase